MRAPLPSSTLPAWIVTPMPDQTSFTGAAMAAGDYPAADDGLADRPLPNVSAGGGGRGGTTTSTAPVQVQQRVVYDKVGRNDPCPCGSGKKYKKCHGA